MYKEKNLIKKIFSKQITITAIGLIVIVFISIPLAKNISKQYRAGEEIDNLKNEIGGLENKNSQLKNVITYLESDQFVDEKARLNLNYKQPGEEVVVIKNKEVEEEGNNIINSAEKGATKVENNMQKWLKYFFVKK